MCFRQAARINRPTFSALLHHSDEGQLAQTHLREPFAFPSWPWSFQALQEPLLPAALPVLRAAKVTKFARRARLAAFGV
eukprot:CAMPEP_0115497768 /NCGR_PEP_ID=MMETSP0271-20121206/66453_1 /TAXON_ID=71861 /ORGANISM="Scrippsiella trochoidea, Strain CCMP3099" /LENGTH=78 /DNA_ID=CAMNT_0002926483 /DNA_START=163 /DNA_END=400 /DNA_ORIENTATION=+